LSLLPAAPAFANHTTGSKARLEQTRRQLRATRALYRKAKADDRALSTVLNRYTGLLTRERGHLASARSHLARINFEMNQAQKHLDALARERRQRSETIANRARALYVMGPVNGFGAIAKSGTLKDFVERAGALQYVATFDRTVLQDLARIAHEVRLTKLSLGKERTRAAQLTREVTERANAVGEIVNAKAEAHRSLQARIADYREEIRALEAEAARIERLIQQRAGGYTGSIGTGPPSRLGFVWPTAGRHITSGYGRRWGGFHSGIDIDCRTGDPIASSKDGRVIASEWGGAYGNMVIIDHGGGYTTLYAHLSRRYVGEGRIVEQRTVLGACGSTGRSTGDHLHFEVRINGRHTNPRPYLP